MYAINRVVSKNPKNPTLELRYNNYVIFFIDYAQVCDCFSRLGGFDVSSISSYFQAHPCSAVLVRELE